MEGLPTTTSELERELSEDATATISRIPWDKAPTLPPWASYDERFKFPFTRQLIVGTVVFQRELTQPEVDALFEHDSRHWAMQKWITDPAELGVAYYLWDKGRASFKFPFLKADRLRFSPDRFGGRFFLPLWTGRYARFAWHSMRALSYLIVSHFTVRPLVGSAIRVRINLAAVNDPRLQDIVRADMELRRRRSEAERQGHPVQSSPFQGHQGRHGDPAGSPASPSQQAQPFPPVPAAVKGPEVKAHPQDFQERDSSAQTTGDNQEDSRSDDKFGQPDESIRNRPQPSMPPSYTPTPSSAPDRDSSLPDGGSDTFGDASPVAPVRRGQPSQHVPASSGSSWDRLRRQAGQGGGSTGNQGGRGRGQQPAWGGMGDQAQHQSSSDNEQEAGEDDAETAKAASERERAQKEFDEMLERERQGESDNGRRRWS